MNFLLHEEEYCNSSNQNLGPGTNTNSARNDFFSVMPPQKKPLKMRKGEQTVKNKRNRMEAYEIINLSLFLLYFIPLESTALSILTLPYFVIFF